MPFWRIQREIARKPGFCELLLVLSLDQTDHKAWNVLLLLQSVQLLYR